MPIRLPAGMQIKSIQQVQFNVTVNGSNNATITAVDTTKTILVWSKTVNSTSDTYTANGVLTLFNSTTVTFITRTTPAANFVVNCFVIEFSSGVKSIQSGTMSINTAGNDATISAVDTTKSLILYMGCHNNQASAIAAMYLPMMSIVNSTTIRANCGGSSPPSQHVCGYMVVEFF